jgi:hypothetical protein
MPALSITIDNSDATQVPPRLCLGGSTIRLACYHIIDNTLHLV